VGLDAGTVAACPAALQDGGEFGELAGGLGDGLVEAAGLPGVQGRRVGEDDPSLGAERRDPGLVPGQPGEPRGVDDG